MKGRVGQIVLFLVGLAFVVGVAAAVGVLFVLAIRAGSTVGAALIAALATVTAALVVRSFERRKVMEEIRREQLSDVYTEFAQVLHGRSASDEERGQLMLEFMRKSLIYASAGTIRAFSEWDSQIPEEGAAKEDWKASSLRYEAFVKAMRKDLGISNWRLQEGELIRMGIYDFDQ
jgi:LPS O-antigen subunit length determinant protein (WzzB/FepE family)